MGEDTKYLERISIDSKIMTGKPVIKGTRLTVDFILNRLAHGDDIRSLVAEYEGVTSEDISACLYFASQTLKETGFIPLAANSR